MMSGPWHDMAQVGSCWPFTKQALAQSQAKQRGICGGECGMGMRFPSSTVIPRLMSDPANEFFGYRRFFSLFFGLG